MKQVLAIKQVASLVNMEGVLGEYQELFLSNNRFEGVDYKTNRYLLDMIFQHPRFCAVKHLGAVLFGVPIPRSWDYKGDVKTFSVAFPQYIGSTATMLPIQKIFTEGVDGVIGFYTNEKISVAKYLDYYVTKIIEIDNAIDYNREQLKVPWVLRNSTKNKNLIDSIETAMKQDKHFIGSNLNADEMSNISLELKTEYLIDKYQIQREKYEAKIKSLLGVNNVNFEKKERLITGEVEANNEEINAFKSSHDKNVQAFCDECNSVLDTNLQFNIDTVSIMEDNKDEENAQDETSETDEEEQE